MQKLPIDIIAEWDQEASVWVATSEDIGGFVMEDATLERLVSRVPGVLDGGVVSRHSANGVLKQAGLPKAF